METVSVNYKGFVIDQMARGVWYVRRPGSWLECMWAPRTETATAQAQRIDRYLNAKQGWVEPSVSPLSNITTIKTIPNG